MIEKSVTKILGAMGDMLIENYQASINNTETTGTDFYCIFTSVENLSSNQFEEIEKRIKGETGENFLLTGISGVETGQKISGKWFPSEEELENYLESTQSAKQYDHKFLGKKLEIFNMDPVAPGMPFWLNNGETIITLTKNCIHKIMQTYGYERIITPIFAKTELWKKSGHYEMYKDSMFIFQSGNEEYSIKPMSCPLHVTLLKNRRIAKSQLPIRLAEFGHCHRNEASGALNGLLRCRSLTQDDAHVFCSEEQMAGAVVEFCEMLKKIYANFGLNEVIVFLATRPEKYIGSLESWERAEDLLGQAIKKAGHDFSVKKGDGAFYGPKIEFHIRDNLGRLWQCGTCQADFMMAERLELTYDDQGVKSYPIILHHAILGSMERFIGIILEQTKGWLPIWLAPIQILLIPIGQDIGIENITSQIEKAGIRYKINSFKDSLSDKVKKSTSLKIPAVIVIGKRELESGFLPVRLNGSKEVMMKLEELIELIKEKTP